MDAALFDRVQRQSFLYFWDGGHPASGLARDTIGLHADPAEDLVTIGGSGFGVMAILVAAYRGWITREAALERLGRMVGLLESATCYHGLFPHFMNGRSGATIPFARKDDGGDIVETALMFQGLLCARQYFDGDAAGETGLRGRIGILWEEVEWSWQVREGHGALTWHWSPNNGFALDHELRGWDECLLPHVLAAASPRYPIDAAVYHEGWAQGPRFRNGRRYYDLELPLGPDFGGPLFFSHHSFCGLDPRGLKDRYADYWRQNTQHVRINHAHCLRNPGRHKGYGPDCWGLTSSDGPGGYEEHAPDRDNGVVTPSAALSSFPYLPDAAAKAMRHFHEDFDGRLWGRYGFVDAFCEDSGWVSQIHSAIDQGPIVAMMENHRSGLLWNLFMRDPDVQRGLRRLGFESPHLK